MNNIFERSLNVAAESLLRRFLRNAGIEDMVDHPKDYKIEAMFTDSGAVIRIDRKKKTNGMTVDEFKDSLNGGES